MSAILRRSAWIALFSGVLGLHAFAQAPQVPGAEIEVTTTRTDQRLGDVPASVNVLGQQEIQESPAVVLDDVLRQMPAFSLFRRASSLGAHPTAQGVSLRGIGPSGVSRTLVLLDGIPFNDPFGGWVYWTRAPLTSINRIELVESSGSSIYGNYAMGGVINLRTQPAEKRTLVLRPQYGGRKNATCPVGVSPCASVWDGLGRIDFMGSDTWKSLGVVVDGGFLQTNGYPIVPATDPFNNGAQLRGIIDTKATVNYQNVNVKLTFKPTDKIDTFLRTGYFSEDRSNAKLLEANDTLWKYVSMGTRVQLPNQTELQTSITTNFEAFHSTFVAVPATTPSRNVTRLTLLQKVPVKDVTWMAQLSRPFTVGSGSIFNKHFVSIGFDWRWVDGDSVEQTMDAATGTSVTLNRVSGGTQQILGFFIQDLIALAPRLQLSLSARVDHWRNYDSHNREVSLATGVTATDKPSCSETPTLTPPACLADKENTQGSPKIGLLYHLTDTATVWGSASWGFRAPTLNELYRQFRVGTRLTLANDQLGPEKLVGGEIGVNLAPVKNVTWRSTWFLNRVKDPVSNVTLSSTTALVTLQRQNLSNVHINGIQSDVEYRPRQDVRLSGAYIYNTPRVKEYTATNPTLNPSLVGNFLPQVPRHRGSARITYANKKYATASLEALFTSAQFDNDLNTLRLPGYGVVDLNFNRQLRPNLDAFFGIQNLFNRTFYVQTGPTTTGAPRLITGGFQITLKGH